MREAEEEMGRKLRVDMLQADLYYAIEILYFERYRHQCRLMWLVLRTRGAKNEEMGRDARVQMMFSSGA